MPTPTLYNTALVKLAAGTLTSEEANDARLDVMQRASLLDALALSGLGLQKEPAEGGFEDDDKTKLDSIEPGATADQDVRVRLEGGGLVAQGAADPTSGGANTGANSFISGESNQDNSGDTSLITGSFATNNTLDFARVHGGGSNARILDLVAKVQTTGITETTMTLGGGVEGATNRIVIPVDTAWGFQVTVVAKSSSSANARKLARSGLIINNGGTVSISTVDTIGTDRNIGVLACSIDITADDTNDALKIAATGVSLTTIDWTARVELTQVG